MIPPHCKYSDCNSNLIKKEHACFELVEFKSDEYIKNKYEKNFNKPSWVGHRHNLIWFCCDHAKIATKYVNETFQKNENKILDEIRIYDNMFQKF